DATSQARIFPHPFCPCGVVQPTRLPLMQEITGAKPVRDANFRAPQSILSNALLWYGSQFSATPGGRSSLECGNRSALRGVFHSAFLFLPFLLPGRLIVGQRPLKARMLVQIQPRQPLFFDLRWQICDLKTNNKEQT